MDRLRITQLNSESLNAGIAYNSTDNTSDLFFGTLPPGTYLLRVQTVHSDFVDQNKNKIWGFGTMIAFGNVNDYHALLYITAQKDAYIRHYNGTNPYYGWIKFI